MTERDIGQIFEGIKNLNERYDCQEKRLGRVEEYVHELHTDVIGQRTRCMVEFDRRYASKESLQPIEHTCNTIKKAAIYVFCAMVSVMVVVAIYVERTLL